MIRNKIFRILLLLDNAPTHSSAEELNEIDPNGRVMYLLPNVTSLVQLIDQGVIWALKRRYKTGFLYEMLSRNHKQMQNLSTQSTLCNAWKKLLPNYFPDSLCDFPSNTELTSPRRSFWSHDWQSAFKHLRWTGLANWWRLSSKFKLQWHGRRRGS